jgi:hypothetical protein
VWPCLLLVGCNVGPAFRDHRVPKGPLTSPTSPAGIDESRLTSDLKIVSAEEVDLVEEVLVHRAKYHRALDQLRDYYHAHGYATKESWAAFELKELRNVQAFRYIVDAEIPSDRLRADEAIAEADTMYDRGVKLMQQGGHHIPAVFNRDLMLQAAAVFRGLIEQYPASDKIDDAAFQLGEIHAEYLPDQETLAVRWFERSFTWDAATPHPARYRAAVLYDYRLRDRGRALELYRASIEHDTRYPWHVRAALRRVDELTREDVRRSAG